jgi:hypothetical protein
LIPQSNLPPRKRKIPGLGFFSPNSELSNDESDLQVGLKEALEGLTASASVTDEMMGSTPDTDQDPLESSLSNDTLEDGLNDIEVKLLMGMKAVISKKTC